MSNSVYIAGISKYLPNRLGSTANAVCVGSEMLSRWMLAKFFQKEFDNEQLLSANPMLSFDKESFILMLEELARTKPLKSGQRILLFVPESARFSNGVVLLTVC